MILFVLDNLKVKGGSKMDRFMDDREPQGHSQNDFIANENVRDHDHEGKEKYEMDIDRMINEGLGGGYVGEQNGHIGDSSTDYM